MGPHCQNFYKFLKKQGQAPKLKPHGEWTPEKQPQKRNRVGKAELEMGTVIRIKEMSWICEMKVVSSSSKVSDDGD